MSSISAACIAGLLAAFDFSQIAKLVDVGGAHGALGAITTFRDSGLEVRCDFVGGDFLDDDPAGADAYLLSAVLARWGR